MPRGRMPRAAKRAELFKARRPGRGDRAITNGLNKITSRRDMAAGRLEVREVKGAVHIRGIRADARWIGRARASGGALIAKRDPCDLRAFNEVAAEREG